MTSLVREQVKFWRIQDCGNLEMMRATYVNHSFARHTHETFGFGIIEQGATTFPYQGTAHVIPAGNILIINPGEIHAGHAAIPEGWTYWMLYPEATLFQNAMCQVAEERVDLPYFPVPNIRDEDLAQVIRRLLMTLQGASSLLERESRLIWTLTHLIARHASARPAVPPVGDEHKAVKQVQSYLEEHYFESVSLEQLARLANLKPLRLLRVFRKQVGLPPHAYLTQVRIFRAKALLSVGWLAAEVAQEIGFTDQSHFTRHFKRFTGITPGQYQIACKNVQAKDNAAS